MVYQNMDKIHNKVYIPFLLFGYIPNYVFHHKKEKTIYRYVFMYVNLGSFNVYIFITFK